jgi:NAD(P)-dependent dehydrogenase (short-subunit alcohol dehydrogenase family)
VSVALVTGASRGVGQELARGLAADGGFDVAIAARTDLDETAALVERSRRRALRLQLDVTDAPAVEAAVAAAERELGPLDLLVNNAGSDRAFGPLWEADAELWWGDVEVHLRGTFLLCRAVLPRMLGRGTGRVVNVASSAGMRPSPNNSAYGAAKAAILNVTQSLAESLEGTGVYVFSISPGYVLTAMTERLLELQEERGLFPHLVGRQPVDPSLASQLVLQLASGKADRLSGRYFHAAEDLDQLMAME